MFSSVMVMWFCGGELCDGGVVVGSMVENCLVVCGCVLPWAAVVLGVIDWV